jgi:hypothetical protein
MNCVQKFGQVVCDNCGILFPSNKKFSICHKCFCSLKCSEPYRRELIISEDKYKKEKYKNNGAFSHSYGGGSCY